MTRQLSGSSLVVVAAAAAAASFLAEELVEFLVQGLQAEMEVQSSASFLGSPLQAGSYSANYLLQPSETAAGQRRACLDLRMDSMRTGPGAGPEAAAVGGNPAVERSLAAAAASLPGGWAAERGPRASEAQPGAAAVAVAAEA